MIKIPDYNGGFVTKAVEGNFVITRDNNGCLLNSEPVNHIKKGLTCKYGKIIDYSENIVVLKKVGSIKKIDRQKLNNYLLKSFTGLIEKPEVKQRLIKGTLNTPIGEVVVDNITEYEKSILTDPDSVTLLKNKFNFAKHNGKSIYYASIEKEKIFGNKILKAINVVEKRKRILIKGMESTIKMPEMPKGPAWNVKGGQKPGAKYIQRKPHPSGEGYIYLYELPSGKKQWRDDSGNSVDSEKAEQAGEYNLEEFKAGDNVKIGEKIGKVKEISDNFLAVNIEGKVELINKKEHIERLKEHQLYKPGMTVNTKHGEGKIIQLTDNLALIKTHKDNTLRVVNLEKHIRKISDKEKRSQFEKINKYSRVSHGYAEQEYQEDVDTEQLNKLPEYQEFQKAAQQAGFGDGELERKKFVKVGGEIRSVKWEFDTRFNEVKYLVDGVKDHPLDFLGKRYFIRDITEEGYSLQDQEGNTGLFLSHKDYEAHKPKPEETEIEKVHGGEIIKTPKRTIKISGELSPEQQERVDREKIKVRGYRTRWKKTEDKKLQTEEEKQRIAAERESKLEKVRQALSTDEYKEFEKRAGERGFKIGENKFTGLKTVEIEGRKFRVSSQFDPESGISTEVDGPTKELTLGDTEYPITDISKDTVYYNDNGEEKSVSIEDLRTINGKALFEPTKESKGYVSKNEAERFYFGTDEKDSASGYYEIVEADDLIASHKPGGEANENYTISDAQNRDRGSAQSLAQINKIAANPNFDFLSNNRTAQDGAPIVNEDYNIIAGNGRGIGVQLHYQNKGEKYKNDLLANAEKLGFDKSDISGMKNPVLIRRINVDNKEAQRLGAISNTSTMLATEAREEARGKATRIDDRTFNNLADIFKNAKGEHSSISEYLDEVGPDLVKTLSEKGIIPENERHLYFNSTTGKVEGSHKDKIKTLLTQSILGDSHEHFEHIPDAAREGITKGLGELFALKGQEGDIIPDMQNAVKILAKYDAVKDKFAGPDTFISQQINDAFEPLSATGRELAIFETLTSTKPNEIKGKIKEYVKTMEGDMFEPGLKPEEAFKKVFGLKYEKGVNKGLLSKLKLFGRRLAKGVQLDLFTGAEEDGKKLLPSKKNPTVRRWQKNEEQEKKPDAQPKNKEEEFLEFWGMIAEDEKKLKQLRNWEEGYYYDPKTKKRIAHLKGEKNSIDVSEFKDKVEGMIFTHNHPSNGPFSGGDVLNLLHFKLSEIRAIGTNGNLYRMTVSNKKLFNNITKKSVDELLKEFNKMFNSMFNLNYRRYCEDVNEGRISTYEAQFNHYNEVWYSIAPVIGCKYEVVKNYVN